MLKLLYRFILVAFVAAVAIARPAASAHAAPVLQTVAVVGGQPDDITTDAQGRLVWGDIERGTVLRLDGSHVTTLASGLSVPEGIVALPDGDLIVAEQGRDRLLRLRLGAHERTSVIYTLRPVPGQEGVDGIGRNPRTGELLIPDSPHGVVLGMDANGRHVRVIARGLGRPVDAKVDARGDVLIPDEHLGTLVMVTPRGKVSYHGAFATPDDVAVDSAGRIWITSLGDGGLWVIAPGAAPRRVLYGLANPQGLTLDRCGNPVIVQQNLGRIDRLLLNPAVHCQ